MKFLAKIDSDFTNFLRQALVEDDNITSIFFELAAIEQMMISHADNDENKSEGNQGVNKADLLQKDNNKANIQETELNIRLHRV